MMQEKLKLILLVDDDNDDNFFHKREISKANVAEQVHVCLDGEDALEYLKCEGSYAGIDKTYPRPDLIFLDINMPKVNGWEFLDKYNQLPEEKKGGEVIVMLTTSLNPDDIERARAMGIVQEFLNKPLRTEDLLKIVKRYFIDQSK